MAGRSSSHTSYQTDLNDLAKYMESDIKVADGQVENAVAANAGPAASGASSMTLGMRKDMQRKAMEDEEIEKDIMSGATMKSKQKAVKEKPMWSLRLSLKTEASKLVAKSRSALEECKGGMKSQDDEHTELAKNTCVT